MDAGAIERLSEAIAESRAQEASIAGSEREHPDERTRGAGGRPGFSVGRKLARVFSLTGACATMLSRDA
jgi:hypothetical protein